MAFRAGLSDLLLCASLSGSFIARSLTLAMAP
jgi:hypothetical protein